MTFGEAYGYLLSLGHETLTIKLGLKNTETLLAALGNPERNYRAVQIAGTNGKGSTAAFIDSICRAASIRTALFTSPHLISITERIKVEGEPITENEFARLTARVKECAEQLVARGELETLPTFFEHVTAIALLAFADAGVKLAVLETGLGGRLDSTTAAQAEVVAITAIAMDHQEYLGHTLPEIAGEKAAIIRPGVAAIVAPQQPSALEVIVHRCKAMGVEPRLLGLDDATAGAGCVVNFGHTTRDGRAVVSLTTRAETQAKVTLALRGFHQVDNAATAVSIAAALGEKGFHIPDEAVVLGLETATHAGRLELWPGSPRFLFDGAHNPAAARALRSYLDEFVRQPITMIFAAMGDKALKEMMASLIPRAARVILTTPDNPRAAAIEELRAAVPATFDESQVVSAPTVAEALEIANAITPPDALVCVTGSLHLIGEAQKLLRHSLKL